MPLNSIAAGVTSWRQRCFLSTLTAGLGEDDIACVLWLFSHVGLEKALEFLGKFGDRIGLNPADIIENWEIAAVMAQSNELRSLCQSNDATHADLLKVFASMAVQVDESRYEVLLAASRGLLYEIT